MATITLDLGERISQQQQEVMAMLGELYIERRMGLKDTRAMQAKYIEADNRRLMLEADRKQAAINFKAIRQREATLKRHLKKYGDHVPGCPMRFDAGASCACGLIQAATETDAEREVDE